MTAVFLKVAVTNGHTNVKEPMATGKKKTPKKKPRKAPPPPPSPSLGLRYFRGAFALLCLFGVLGLVASFIMREAVINRLTTRTLNSNAAVLSRAVAIDRTVNLNSINFFDRIVRLGYRSVSATPRHPGEYFHASDHSTLSIYSREFSIPENVSQRALLVELNLSAAGDVIELRDVKFNRSISNFWLEPELLSILGDSDTRAVSPRRLAEFSPYLRDAVLAIEDQRFYSHPGVDPQAIGRALLVNIKAGRVVQGASTLTQQLAKNLFLESQRTFSRKIVEALSAILIETAFSKDQILEFYLNEIFLGQNGRVAIHGFGEAARSFFGREVSNLSLAQAATLAGIIKAPSYYSPRRHPRRASTRKKIVLAKMLELEKITQKEKMSALQDKVSTRSAPRAKRRAPYFVDYVRRELSENVSPSQLETGNVRIHTGLDLEYQACAEGAVSQGINTLEKRYSWLSKNKERIQSALIAVEPSTGAVLAWVGGRDFASTQFDRVSRAKRQPGSAFKPFVYLTALDGRLNSYRVARATSILLDKPLSMEIPGSDIWEPQNYDKEFRGEVTVREALTNSLNIPTVNLAMKVGVNSIANTAELFGFGEHLPRVPSLALGAGEVTPLELARAYSTLANGGYLLNLRPILAISKDSDQLLFDVPLAERRVVTEPALYVLNTILQDVVDKGTGRVVRRLGFDGPVAGKTGTSNDARDSWFVGFTPRLLAIAWVGFDSSKPLKLTGAQAAAPIWTRFMKCADKMEPQLDFVAPPGVVFRDIDTRNGLLDDGFCPRSVIRKEVFVENTEPQTNSPCKPLPGRRYGEEPYGYELDRGQRRERRPVNDFVNGLFKALFGRQ